MRILLALSVFITSHIAPAQNILVKDAYSAEPVSFATVGFGDGLGTFTNANGVFRFSKRIYPNIDTLFISSIGYQNLTVPVKNIEGNINLVPDASSLETVVVNAALTGKFRKEDIKTVSHKEYEDCWLPTVESEIAVRFDRVEGQPTMISKLEFPILLEESQRSKRGTLRKFSTLFRLQFYDVEPDGSPTHGSYYPSQTFIITQNSDQIHELDVTGLRMVIPKSGIFAAIQVLGYTKPNGDLINAKKYREIKTRMGYKKVSTTYRPLLPFTGKIKGKNTWVRNVFANDKEWQLFDLDYNSLSALVRSGHNNYGMGAELRVYERKD